MNNYKVGDICQFESRFKKSTVIFMITYIPKSKNQRIKVKILKGMIESWKRSFTPSFDFGSDIDQRATILGSSKLAGVLYG